MATRFYYQANNAPAINPPLDAGWGSTANAVRRLMGTAKDATTETINGDCADGSSSLGVQLVSPPLAAQTITGTVTVMSRGRELNIDHNVNKRYRSIRVYAADGSLRGTFNPFAATASTTELSAVSYQGQIHAQNNGVGTLAVSDGDYIVAEIGYGVGTSAVAIPAQWSMIIGGTGTDHAVSNSDTTGTVPWLEFSQTLVFTAATVTLTPATATVSGQFVPATPGPVTMSLTPATATRSAVAVTPTPGVVTVNLTPATATRTAVAVTPTPLSTGVILTPAVATSAAVAVTPSPGVVTTSIQPGLVSLTPLTLTPQPLAPNVNLTAATATLTAKSNTVTPGVVTVSLTRATATLTGVAPTGVQPGVTVAPLTPAALTLTPLDFGVTPGLVNVNLTPATATVAAAQTTPAGVGPSGLTLTPATASLSGVTLTVHPGLVLAPLTRAAATWSGVPLGLEPGPVTVALTSATASLGSVTVSPAPGPVTTALTSASAIWAGGDLDAVPGELSTFTLFGTATWTALPVAPAPVEGVLLRPALATLTARKVRPVGSVLPLNEYELPMARILLDSLEQVFLTRTDNPPMHFALRLGQEVPWDLSERQDLCCEGLAYVKINRVYPSTNFPDEDEGWSPCGPLAYAADLEIGVLRCAPVGTEKDIPTDQEWADAADVVHNDSAAMALAIEEFGSRIDPLTEWLVRPWSPLGPAGACTGGVQVVTVGWIPC